MHNTLPISRLIDVDVILSPISAQAQDLSTLLILGTSDVIDVTERLRSYSSLDAVAADFGTTAPEYLSAVLWFEQAPQPNKLDIGRWAKTASAGELLGGALSAAQQAIAVWNAITTPAFTLFIDGVPRSVAPASLSAVSNLNGVAAIIQASLQVINAGITFVWNANLSRFELESGTTGPSSSVGFMTVPTAVGNINFSVNPSNNDTITLNGTVVTFRSTGPIGNQVLIGIDLPTTLQNLLTFLQSSVDVQIVKFNYGVTGNLLTLVAGITGVPGNALTIAASAAVASGATLSGGSGTDISALLVMNNTLNNGAYLAPGVAAESALDTAILFDARFGQEWYALVMPAAVDADHLDVAGFIQGCDNKHVYGITSSEAGILSSVSTTDIASMVKALNYSRTTVQFSSSNPYAVCSYFGRGLTVNYNGNSTVITLMYKQEPGIVAENLTASQADAVNDKNANLFAAYNNDTAIIQYGKQASGDYSDTVFGVDWLAVTIMTALYNLLYTTNTKVPQTDAGTHLLVNVIAGVLSQAVNNGLVAPGVWNSNGFGTLQSGDYMQAGFYIYAPPVALQLQSDREARKSVPIQVAVKLAGAVHTVSVTLNINR